MHLTSFMTGIFENLPRLCEAKTTLYVDCGPFSLSATCSVSESIIGAKEGGEGAGDGVAVGGDRGGRRHPVVQDALLSPIHLLVLL